MSDLTTIAKVVAIALACGAALAGTNWLTEEKIHYNEAAVLKAAITDLLPAGADATAYPPEVDRLPGAWTLCTGHLLGRSNVRGYAGDIRLLYTLNTTIDPQPDGAASNSTRLVRLAVLGHQETPGITDFLAEPEWLSRFNDRSADDVEAIDAITGATITSDGIRSHLSAVLREPTGQLGQPIQLACAE